MLILDLQKKAYNLGLAKEERLKIWKKKKLLNLLNLEEFLRETSLKPGIINPILEANESSPGRPSVQSSSNSYQT